MTTSTHTTDSAYLVQVQGSDRWELRDVELPGCRCFDLGHHHPGKILASGSLKACEGAAKLLGYHIDIIQPLESRK